MRTFVAAGLLSVAVAVAGAGTASAADGPQSVEVEGGWFAHKSAAQFMNVGGENGVTWAGEAEAHSGGGLEVEAGD
ncbi:hypothetical protein DN402_04010 [Streptomyces sp. SW4]|nr:hypothetical protein DN402_04010 [Streptomyces sp. SW4]